MKKVLAVMLSMMFAVSLAACGNSGVTASNAASETVAASKTESNADSKPEDSKAESSQEDGASQSEDAELVVNNQDKDVNSTRSNDLQLEIVKEEMVEGYNTDPYAIMDADAYVVTIKNNNPMGDEVSASFTVGENRYEPRNPHAEVFNGDNVTFTWEVTTEAERYVITLFWNGEFYSTLTVSGTSKTTTMPKDGTWTWTVQAFNRGENDNFFEVSNAIEGNAFESKGADIPEDAIELEVWGIEAAYLDEFESQFPTGKYGWMIILATGEEGGTGYPQPWLLVYTDKQDAVSGVYNVARNNLDLESTYLNTNGTQAGCIMATDGELRLQFDGFHEEYFEQGYAYPYYTGSFRLVCTDGKTYVGKFMEQFCNSYNFSTYGSGVRDHHGMWDEDGQQGIETIQVPETGTHKILHEGQLYIIRDKAIYNVSGLRVR